MNMLAYNLTHISLLHLHRSAQELVYKVRSAAHECRTHYTPRTRGPNQEQSL